MSVFLRNNAEIGSNGANVTTGNSGGSGNTAWNAVVTGGTSTVTYSSTKIGGGALSYKFATDASNTVGTEWSLSTQIGTTMKTVYISFKVYFAGTVYNNSGLVTFSDLISTICGTMRITSSDKLSINGSNGTAVATSTTTIPADQWIRIESKIVCANITGFMEARIYLNADSSTPTEVINSTASTVNTTIDLIDFGLSANAGQVVYFDDFIFRSDAYPDPPYHTSVSWFTF